MESYLLDSGEISRILWLTFGLAAGWLVATIVLALVIERVFDVRHRDAFWLGQIVASGLFVVIAFLIWGFGPIFYIMIAWGLFMFVMETYFL